MTTERLSDDVRASLARAVDQYSEALLRNPDCLTYLAKRGIDVDPNIPEECGNPFRLGYVECPAMPEHDHRVGMLAIPYLVPLGTGPVGMKFRALDGSLPKYKAQHGMGTHLFGVNNFSVDSPILGITEGELDAIVATQTGIPSVAVPGVSSWRDEWRFCFEGYESVLIFGDGDGPGREFSMRLTDAVPNARQVDMPDGHDVSSLVVDRGVSAFKNRAGV